MSERYRTANPAQSSDPMSVAASHNGAAQPGHSRGREPKLGRKPALLSPKTKLSRKKARQLHPVEAGGIREQLGVLPPRERARKLREWMDKHTPPLSFREAADQLGTNASYIQLTLAPLNVGADVQVLFDERKGSLGAAQRIDLVRNDPELRRWLIEQFKGGVPFTQLRPHLDKYFRRMRGQESSDASLVDSVNVDEIVAMLDAILDRLRTAHLSKTQQKRIRNRAEALLKTLEAATEI